MPNSAKTMTHLLPSQNNEPRRENGRANEKPVFKGV